MYEDWIGLETNFYIDSRAKCRERHVQAAINAPLIIN